MAPFKMKGSPMKRNFGIGSPLHDEKKKIKGKAPVDPSKKKKIKGDPPVDPKTKKTKKTIEEKWEESAKKAIVAVDLTEALSERSRIRKSMKDVIEHAKGKTSKKTKKSD